MPSSDQLIYELAEALNAHDIQRMLNCYAEGYQGIDVGEARPQNGTDSVRTSIARYLVAFPDLSYIPEEVICQANRIAVVWRAQGTHLGNWANIPPTGRKATIQGMSLFTVEEGKITHALTVWDVAGLLRAIGLLPRL